MVKGRIVYDSSQNSNWSAQDNKSCSKDIVVAMRSSCNHDLVCVTMTNQNVLKGAL